MVYWLTKQWYFEFWSHWLDPDDSGLAGYTILGFCLQIYGPTKPRKGQNFSERVLWIRVTLFNYLLCFRIAKRTEVSKWHKN